MRRVQPTQGEISPGGILLAAAALVGRLFARNHNGGHVMLRRVLVTTAVLALAVLANADSAPGFPYPPNWTATHVDADWYDISVDPGGMWYLANFTIIPDPGHEYDWCGTVSGFYWVASTGGEWHQFGFDLPLQGLSV